MSIVPESSTESPTSGETFSLPSFISNLEIGSITIPDLIILFIGFSDEEEAGEVLPSPAFRGPIAITRVPI
jgi:hypothetical protein